MSSGRITWWRVISHLSEQSIDISCTKKEIQNIANTANRLLDKHITVPSKWSGKIELMKREANCPAGKQWNCNIVVADINGKGSVSLPIMMHELLHARPISYYSLRKYLLYSALEEAAVQMMNSEICKSKNIKVPKSGYMKEVGILKKINALIKYGTDYDFAHDLYLAPVPEREAWLHQKIFDFSLRNGYTIDETERLLKNIDDLKGK